MIASSRISAPTRGRLAPASVTSCEQFTTVTKANQYLRANTQIPWRRVLWYPTQAKTGLDPDFLPRCVREVRVCAFLYGKAHGVYQRHKPPQEIGAMGHPAVGDDEASQKS